MPKIPTYTASGEAQGVQFGQVPGAPPPGADPGQALRQLGERSADIVNALDRQQGDIEAVATQSKYDAAMKLLHTGVFSDPSITNPEAEFVERAAVIQKDTLAGTQRPDVRGALQGHFNRTFPAAVVNVHFDHLKVLGSQNLAQIDQLGDIKSKEAAEAETPQKRQEAIDTYEALVRRGVGPYGLSAQQAAQKLIAFNNQVLEKNMDYLRQTNPQRMWALEQEGAFRNMDPNARANTLKAYNKDREHELTAADTNFTKTSALVLDGLYVRANAGALTKTEMESLARGENPYVKAHEVAALKHRNDNPIIGTPGTGNAAALASEYELNWQPSLAYVNSYRAKLKHLQSTIGEKDPDITKLAQHINADTRSILGIGNVKQGKDLQDVTDRVDANQTEVPPFLKKFLPNNEAVDKATARGAVRRGATPEQAAESVKKKNDAKKDAVPERNKRVLDLVPR